MKNYDEQNPLHLAVSRQELGQIKDLIAKQIKIDSRDEEHLTPLMLAAEKGYDEIVEFLIKAGANINARTRATVFTEGKRSPLYIACQNGKKSTVELLLKFGADPNLAANNSYPLHSAILLGRYDIAILLLSHGADPNGVEGYESPILVAASRNNLNMIRELLSRGANPTNALIAGIKSAECARELLDRGADVNARDRDGRTPLLIAINMEKLDLIKLYIEAGADVNAKDNDESSAIMYMLHMPIMEVAEMLVAAGADINACTKRGVSVLDCFTVHACEPHLNEKKAIAEFLRSKGAKRGAEIKAEAKRTTKSPSPKTPTAEEGNSRANQKAGRRDDFSLLRDSETSAGNYDLDTEDIVERLEKWKSICSFRVVEAKADSISIEFERLPSDLDSFAKEIYEFCPDIVDQGTACIPEMVSSGAASPDLRKLIEGIDLDRENFGLEILKRELQQKKQLTLWWD